MSVAQLLMDAGFAVQFADIEGIAQFDLLFSRDAFAAELECKSLSADAGRQIHRKDFYRFMDQLFPTPELLHSQETKRILLITLVGRLPSSDEQMVEIVAGARTLLLDPTLGAVQGGTFSIDCLSYDDALAGCAFSDSREFFDACRQKFGQNCHVSGGMTELGGCCVVMRSSKEDDSSKPMLIALRKAGTQFTGRRPSFIAIQEHGILPADLMLPHVRRRAAILSDALFYHYRARHVNCVAVSAYGAVVMQGETVWTPGFAIPNRSPAFPVAPELRVPFLMHMPDQAYADMIGAPLPASNISFIPFESE